MALGSALRLALRIRIVGFSYPPTPFSIRTASVRYTEPVALLFSSPSPIITFVGITTFLVSSF